MDYRHLAGLGSRKAQEVRCMDSFGPPMPPLACAETSLALSVRTACMSISGTTQCITRKDTSETEVAV